MSSYYDDRRTSVRERRRDDDYYDDAAYANTRDNQRSTALVKRRDDSPDYDEEVRRDYSPGGGVYRETTIRKSGTRPVGRARSYDYDDRSYDEGRSRYSDRRDSNYRSDRRSGYGERRDSEYRSSRQDRYSDDSSRSRSPPPKRDRRKSMPEEALEALGLGGVAAALTGKKRNSRSGSRDRDGRARSCSGRDRSKSHGREQLTQAFKAAVLAGAATAFRARKEPGGWGGEKGRRILTAAVTAGGVDGLVNLHKDPEQHKLRDTVGSAIAGVAADRLVNGPRSQSRGRGFSPDARTSRSRSRFGDLAAGGTLAAAAKKVTDSIRGRSNSRSRARSRSRSFDSYDSRSPPKRSRSRSIAGRALSAVGLNNQAERVDPARARDRSRSRGGGRRYADDDGSSYYDNREVGTSRSIDPSTGAMIRRPKSAGPDGGLISPPPPDYHLDYGPRHTGDPETDSDSDLGSSSEDEKEKKKGRKRLVISGGLATVATIHAGHSVYQSMEKREARHRAVREGTISKEEAKKNKTRDRMQDAASIGLAALGIKGAYSEWKEMKEQKEEHDQEKEKKERHAWKRENRRRKASMSGHDVYGDHGYANSAPDLHNPFGRDGLMSPPPGGNYSGQGAYYSGDGPYMSGAAQRYTPDQHYQEEAHGWMGQAPEHHDGHNNPYNNPYAPGYAGNGTTNGNMSFPPPPGQGGTGFPPPPAAQPPPPTQTRP